MMYFLSLQAMPGGINMLILELVLTVIVFSLILVRQQGVGRPILNFPRFSPIQWGMVGAAGAATIFAAMSFINLTRALPLGAYDAWSIWNRAARFIYRDPGNWRTTLSPELYWANHADYPLLVPMNIAWGWRAVGGEVESVPMLQGALFTLASAGVMFISLGWVRSPAQGSLAALVLVATPFFVQTGSQMMSDVPLMFYILAACILVFLALARQELILLALAGLMAGLAGWTKNEGLLLIAAIPVALILTQRQGLRSKLVYYFAGLLLPLVVIIYFKTLTPASDLFTGGLRQITACLTDLSRYGTILSTLGRQLGSFGNWSISLPAGLLTYAIVVGRRRNSVPAAAALTIAAIILLQMLGYLAIYLITPYDLAWHLNTSLARLILQIFASALFLYFSILNDPETIFSASLE
jgi:4-amino-4-deoxy-L-arabinose transferase-like glycosyltransferase